jgi:hypothetical protein
MNATNKRQSPGFLYLIREGGGTYKIGKAKDPDDQLRTFEVKLPFPIKLIHTIPCENYHQAESYLHERYQDKRVAGEWFALDDKDVGEIKEMDYIGNFDITLWHADEWLKMKQRAGKSGDGAASQ